MASLQSATIRLSLSRPGAGGVLPRSATTTRRAAAASGAVHFFSVKGSGGRRGRGNLSLCRSSGPVDDDDWCTPQLRPEDLVEPTGQGVEELEAILDALVWEPLRPISLALQEIVATGGNVFRCRCFHAGLLSGSLLLVAGLCQLYKVAPNLFMDIVLGYIFYKLSVLAADLKRNGKNNIICAPIQYVLMVILFFKWNNPTKDFYYHFTKFIWSFGFDVYTLTVYCQCVGIKYPRHLLEALFKKILATIGDLIDRAYVYCVRELGTKFCNLDPAKLTEEKLNKKANTKKPIKKQMAKKPKANKEGGGPNPEPSKGVARSLGRGPEEAGPSSNQAV